MDHPSVSVRVCGTCQGGRDLNLQVEYHLCLEGHVVVVVAVEDLRLGYREMK